VVSIDPSGTGTSAGPVAPGRPTQPTTPLHTAPPGAWPGQTVAPGTAPGQPTPYRPQVPYAPAAWDQGPSAGTSGTVPTTAVGQGGAPVAELTDPSRLYPGPRRPGGWGTPPVEDTVHRTAGPDQA